MENFNYDPGLYDRQINWEARLAGEIKLIDKILEKAGRSRVLDIGCGTAHHLQALSLLAEELVGIDPLPGTIEYARSKVVKASNVVLKVGGFRDLNQMDMKPFNLIMSLGNTLPLLGTRRKVKMALKHCRHKLADSGVLLLQFLNFNRSIIEKNSYYQPKVIRDKESHYVFLKHFEYGRVKTRADFIITKIDGQKKVKQFGVNSSWMCTLKVKLFLKMVYNQGYSRVTLLGPVGEKPFNYEQDISLYALLNK